MASTLIVVPIKPFGVAKRRLAPMLDAARRREMGRAVASHVIATALATGNPTAVVTGDDGVAGWARGLGASVVLDPPGGGLNEAARAAVEEARRRRLRWMIVHADLPALVEAELRSALGAVPKEGVLLCPSYNGGTSLIAADLDTFGFDYGPGSFRRHLAAAARRPHRVLVHTGLTLDLDDPVDLATMIRLPAARWLGSLLPGDGRSVPRPGRPAPLA